MKLLLPLIWLNQWKQLLRVAGGIRIHQYLFLGEGRILPRARLKILIVVCALFHYSHLYRVSLTFSDSKCKQVKRAVSMIFLYYWNQLLILPNSAHLVLKIANAAMIIAPVRDVPHIKFRIFVLIDRENNAFKAFGVANTKPKITHRPRLLPFMLPHIVPLKCKFKFKNKTKISWNIIAHFNSTYITQLNAKKF